MTTFTFSTAPKGAVTQGYYQLQIRRASDFGTFAKGDTTVTITQTFDTTDRLSNSYTLTIPAAMDISDGMTFTIGDGISSVTFQLLDPTVSGVGNPNDVAVDFTAGQTAAEVAAAVAKAINAAEKAGLFTVTAATNGASNHVDLLAATTVSGLPATITVTAPSGNDIPAGMTFTVDGVAPITGDPVTVTFQFVNSTFGGGSSTAIPIDYSSTDTAAQIAAAIAKAINEEKTAKVFTVTAAVDSVFTDHVVLTNATRVTVLSTSQTSIHYMDEGDENQVSPQGQVLLEDDKITYSSQYGITVNPGAYPTDTTGFSYSPPLPGPTAPLLAASAQGGVPNQVPGVVIENCVLAFGGTGGISYSGSTQAAGQSIGSVPFGRIVNNTLYGNATPTGIGINVGANASPTLLNNVVANFATGIEVAATSNTTVVSYTAYSGNTVNLSGITDTDSITIANGAPLFVNAAAGNFYPAEGSAIIDSSEDSLQDRPNMINVRQSLGLPLSPILAPDTDLYGQLRVNDPNVAPPSGGVGKSTYKDRGAIDRTDFVGPTAALTDPLDNDAAGIDRDPTIGNVLVAMVGGIEFPDFTIQLSDARSGIAGYTVLSSNVQVLEDGQPLIEGRDYTFTYNTSTDQIKLVPAGVIWAPGHTYTITLSNAITDSAGNPIQPNRADGTTSFVIDLAGYNFGTAPMYTDLAHTISATLLPDGARHLVVPGVYLGTSIDTSSDATISPTGDPNENGIVFQGGTNLVSEPTGQTAAIKTITVTASVAGVLNAWIDWDNDGVWESVDSLGLSEQVTWTDASGNALPAADLTNGGVNVQAGANTLYFTVPTGLTGGAGVSSFQTYARFRYSTTGTLSDGTPMQPTGEALDGEVEDYQVNVILPPGTISGTVWNDYNSSGTADTGEPGLAGWTVFLDANNNGKLDPGETSVVTGADGTYQFTNVVPGDYYVREVLPQSGWTQTGTTSYLVTVNSDLDSGGNDFFDHDTTPPAVVSMVKGNGVTPGVDPTNASVVQFAVQFTEPVTGLDPTDFVIVAPI